MINHMILKATITDGCNVSEDQLTILCENSVTPYPTMSPTPTPTVTPFTNSILLNSTNNWTYIANDTTVIKFIKTVDTDVQISVPVIDSTELPQFGEPKQIPNFTNIKMGNTIIGQLVFINIYTNKNISISYSDSIYNGIIKNGAITF